MARIGFVRETKIRTRIEAGIVRLPKQIRRETTRTGSADTVATAAAATREQREGGEKDTNRRNDHRSHRRNRGRLRSGRRSSSSMTGQQRCCLLDLDVVVVCWGGWCAVRHDSKERWCVN